MKKRQSLKAYGDLRVACPHANLRRTFEITGLNRVIAVHPSVEEATATNG